MTSLKKKKKVQQQQQPELIGSADYIASHEIDQIIKKGKDRIKHAITVSDEKLTKTKKEIVREMARDLEKAGYPVNQICDRLSKSLKSLVNDRTVRDALESKYKDPSQSQGAAAQNYDGGSLYRQQEQLRKKPVKEVTLDDISKGDFPKSKLKQIVKHQMQKADWWEQQAKQNEAKGTLTKQEEDKDKIIADLREENNRLERVAKSARNFFTEIANSELSDEYVGKAIRTMAKKWGLKDKAKPKHKRKSNTDFISQTWAQVQARSES